MHERNTRFFLDTNVFIAASKRGWTRTTDLVLRLIEGEEDLIVNEALIGEYRKYADRLGDNGRILLDRLLEDVAVLEIPEDVIARCIPFFPVGEVADVLHAATCLSAGGTLISNDRHFEKIRQSEIIGVWTISEAIAKFFESMRQQLCEKKTSGLGRAHNSVKLAPSGNLNLIPRPTPSRELRCPGGRRLLSRPDGRHLRRRRGR